MSGEFYLQESISLVRRSWRGANEAVLLPFPSIVVLLTKIDAELLIIWAVNILHLEHLVRSYMFRAIGFPILKLRRCPN